MLCGVSIEGLGFRAGHTNQGSVEVASDQADRALFSQAGNPVTLVLSCSKRRLRWLIHLGHGRCSEGAGSHLATERSGRHCAAGAAQTVGTERFGTAARSPNVCEGLGQAIHRHQQGGRALLDALPAAPRSRCPDQGFAAMRAGCKHTLFGQTVVYSSRRE